MEHLVIPDEQRHEPKHASTAALNTVCKSNGDGTTRFAFVSYQELTNLPSYKGYERVLSGFSAVSQNPSATNTPLQIEFGAGTSNASVTLSSGGLLTFNQAGDYQVTTLMRFGRTTGAGQAILFNRVLINGLQTLNSNSLTLDNAITVTPFAVTLNITATAGMTMQFQLYRDSAGINNGGLVSQTPTLAGWNISPSATLIVDKYLGPT